MPSRRLALAYRGGPAAIAAPVAIVALAMILTLAAIVTLGVPTPLPAEEAAPLRGEIGFAGPFAEVGDRVYVPAAAKLEPRLGGSAAVVAGWRPTLDGAPVEVSALGKLAAGEHRVGGVVLDRSGVSYEVVPLALTVDAEPPQIHWEVRDLAVFEEHGEPRASRRGARFGRHRGEEPASDFAWSADGRRWVPLAWKPEKLKADTSAGKFEVASERPQVFLRSTGPKISADGKPLELGADKILWIEAHDAGAGVARLAARTRPPDEGEAGPVLEVEAVDLVGNASHASFPVR